MYVFCEEGSKIDRGLIATQHTGGYVENKKRSNIRSTVSSFSVRTSISSDAIFDELSCRSFLEGNTISRGGRVRYDRH